MAVLAFDVSPNHETADQKGFQYEELDTLLSQSDIISLHIPSNPKTHHFLSEEEFLKMKDGVVLINTSRGDIILQYA